MAKKANHKEIRREFRVGVRGDRIKKASRGLAQLVAAITAHALTTLALAIVLVSPALNLSAYADDPLDTICGPTLAAFSTASLSSPPSPTPGTLNTEFVQQKLQYCQAAKSASDGADADGAMWKVWAAVGVVCTYACVASFVGGPTSQFLCMGVSLGGGVTDAIVTKNFTSAMMAVGGVAAGFAANSAVNGGKEVVKEGAKEAGKDGAKEGAKEASKKQDKDIGACLNAAMAAMQTFMKYKAMQDNQTTEQTNLAAAKALQAPPGTAADAGASYQAATGSGVGTNGTSGNGGVANGGIAGSPTQVGNTSNAACAGGGLSGSAIIQCATASDGTLPDFVTGSKFPEEFQKDAGKSLASFLAGNGPPGPQMAGASTHGMNASQSATIASAIDGVAQYVGNSESAAVYAGGGGGGGSGAEETGPDMAALAQSLMDQLNPNGKKKEAATTGVSAVIFANQNRTPAAVSEDRKLSLFDRVTYRYYFVGRRIVLGEEPEGVK